MQADEVCQECAGVLPHGNIFAGQAICLPHGYSALLVERCSSNRMRDIINASQTLPGCVQGSRMQVLAARAFLVGRAVSWPHGNTLPGGRHSTGCQQARRSLC